MSDSSSEGSASGRNDGPPGTSEDRHAAGMRVRREVLGDDHVDRGVARTTDFTAPAQRMFDALKDKKGTRIIAIIWAGAHPATKIHDLKPERFNIILAPGGNILPVMKGWKNLAGAEGAIYYYYGFPKNKVNDWLVAEHKKRYGGALPDFFTAGGMAAGIAAVEAIKKAGSTDTDKLVAAFRDLKVEEPAVSVARLTVKVPEDARLYVDGVRCPLTTDTRTFDTPELEAGRKYSYTLKAEVVRDYWRNFFYPLTLADIAQVNAYWKSPGELEKAVKPLLDHAGQLPDHDDPATLISAAVAASSSCGRRARSRGLSLLAVVDAQQRGHRARLPGHHPVRRRRRLRPEPGCPASSAPAGTRARWS